MSGGQNKTPARGQAQPGDGYRYADAAGIHNLPQASVRAKRLACYRITIEHGESFTIHVKGRDAWALDQLSAAGPDGCTPMDHPAPRWSAYIHNLRKLGVPIETVHEPHGGLFSGTHGRYVMHAVVQKGRSEC